MVRVDGAGEVWRAAPAWEEKSGTVQGQGLGDDPRVWVVSPRSQDLHMKAEGAVPETRVLAWALSHSSCATSG